MDISQFYQTFFEEADELLAEMEQLLLGLDLQAPDSEQLNAIFRAAHSIKGGAATFAFAALTDTTHLLENLLDRARHGELKLTNRMMDTFLETKDILQKQISAYREGGEPEPEGVARICAMLRQLALEANAGVSAAPVAALAALPEAVPVPPAIAAAGSSLKVHFSKVSESDQKLLSEELGNLGQVTAQSQTDDSLTLWLETSCDADDIIAVSCFIIEADQIEITTEAPATPEAAPQSVSASPSVPVPAPAVIFAEVPATTNIVAAAAAATGNGKESNSIRVDVEKVDQIINLVGELVITQSMLTQQMDETLRVRYTELVRGLEVLAQTTRGLQDSVMAIRAQPVKSVFSRMPRLVRELATKTEKKIKLETIGENTEIDKTVIEQLSDPLTHMIRNSADHGIETPEVRAGRGKNETGTIRLSAEQAGGNILIIVEDDGAGINRERVLQVARDKGIVAPDVNPTEEQIDQLIFAPGFSTASEVSDLSGRGVGMDVVLSNIKKIGGSVHVRSWTGKGTRMTLRLPLTLAVLDVMLVKVGGSPYVVPLSSIVETIQCSRASFERVPSGGQVLQVRGEYVQVIDLVERFELVADTPQENRFVVLCEAEGSHKVALVVDDIIGQQQVVIKSLEENFQSVEGVAGGTILGDGNVALIVDVQGLKSAVIRKNAA